jgi:uncharacterized SAM-binding protein YcdF (DUF218 family)
VLAAPTPPNGSFLRRAAPCALAGALAGFLARDLGVVDMASAWLPAAVVGSAFFAARLRTSLGACLGALTVLWLLAAFTPLAAALADGLVRRDPPQKADAVVVLGSRLQADGEPTATAESRLFHAFELLVEGWAPRLIVTEQAGPASPHADLARARMARLHVEAAVVGVGPVHRTRDEAIAVAALCREQGWRRVLVVTSPLHSRRACASLRHEGLEVLSSPAIETLYDVEQLDRPRERLLAFGEALHERAGLWYYSWRGWTAPDERAE